MALSDAFLRDESLIYAVLVQKNGLGNIYNYRTNNTRQRLPVAIQDGGESLFSKDNTE